MPGVRLNGKERPLKRQGYSSGAVANENARTADETVERVRSRRSNPFPLGGTAEGILGPEQELELATRRADGERELVEALLQSRDAMVELAAIGRKLKNDPGWLEEVIRSRIGEDTSEESVCAELVDLLGRVGQIAMNGCPDDNREPDRAALTVRLAEYRWNPRMIDRIVARLGRLERWAEYNGDEAAGQKAQGDAVTPQANRAIDAEGVPGTEGHTAGHANGSTNVHTENGTTEHGKDGDGQANADTGVRAKEETGATSGSSEPQLARAPRQLDAHEVRLHAIALIRQAQGKVEHARARLVSANLRLVAWMARRQVHRGLPLRDLVQEGNIGLMRAADKFDHRRGIRFTTYASFWVRHAVNRALSDQSRTIRLPVHLLEARHKMETARQGLAQELGREPTDEELAQRTGMALTKIQQALQCPKQPLSMETPAFSESEAKLGDLIFDPRAESAVDRISERHVREIVRKMLDTLAPREQLVLKMRFGIDHPDGITLQEIGDALALSRERIRQIEEQALNKLRQRAEPNDELTSFLAG